MIKASAEACPIGDTFVHTSEALCHRYKRLIQRILVRGHAFCFLKFCLTWLLCDAAVQTVVLSVNSVTHDCSWLCWTCMHKVLVLTALFCALPKASQTKALGLPSNCGHSELSPGSQALRMYSITLGCTPHLQCMPYRVCDGIEAPEMAQQQHNAGYYYPDPKQDMWSFGLLLFSFFKRMGQLPHEHQIAIRDGAT